MNEERQNEANGPEQPIEPSAQQIVGQAAPEQFVSPLAPPTLEQTSNLTGPQIVIGSNLEPQLTAQLDVSPVAPITPTHKFAKVYISISLVLLVGSIVLPMMMLASVAGQTGSEFFALLLIPLYGVVGIFGLLNLVLMPIFLYKKFFTGLFKIISIVVLLLSILISGYGAYQIYRVANISRDYAKESSAITTYYKEQEASARSEKTVEQATKLLNSCEVIGFYYTQQDGTNYSENAESTSTGILLYHIPKSYSGTTASNNGSEGKYRMHIADRMKDAMVPIARKAQLTCGIQFWHDGSYEQWKDGHWYFNGTLTQ